MISSHVDVPIVMIASGDDDDVVDNDDNDNGDNVDDGDDT